MSENINDAFWLRTLDNKVIYANKACYHITDGKVVGEHQGAHYFTKGQRKGLHVGGTKEPLFVIDTDVHENVIYTGQGKSHPGLYRRTLFVKNEEVHWVRPDLALEIDGKLEVSARIRAIRYYRRTVRSLVSRR